MNLEFQELERPQLPQYIKHIKTQTVVLLMITEFLAFMCLVSFYGFTYIDGERCFIAYSGKLRCKHASYGKIDSSTCKDPFQCNVIKAGFPITLVLMGFVGLVMVINCVKYKEFPKYIEKAFYLNISLLGSSLIMILCVGFMLMITDFGFNDINIWIVLMQTFGMPICLGMAIGLQRSEKIKAVYQPPDQEQYIQMGQEQLLKVNKQPKDQDQQQQY